MRAFSFLFFLFLGLSVQLQAQYAPPAGMPGSLAIEKSDPALIDWAIFNDLRRGWIDIRDTTLGKVSVGDSLDVNGSADNVVLSLGDGGEVTLRFPKALQDQEGFEFAVFENSFSDVFLELAFVEVSSDGVHFFRFPSHSLSPTNSQVGSFGLLDTRKINNLAGKYRGGFGTPFDLAELPDTALLNKDSVLFVKVIDVVGSIDTTHGSTDAFGNFINDPFPTPFASGGFDLDAIAVLEAGWTSVEQFTASSFKVSPNPTQAGGFFQVSGFELSDESRIMLWSMDGARIQLSYSEERFYLPSSLASGYYHITIEQDGLGFTEQILVR